MPPPPPVGVLLSGGLDSSILLGQLLVEGRSVQPFYVRGGLTWELAERRAVQRFLEALASPSLNGRLSPLVELNLPLRDLYGDHWSVTGVGVPDFASPDEAVFLPGRNPILLVKAAVWCQLHGLEELALAPLASNPFGDASDLFFDTFQRALTLAMDRPLKIVRPFLHRSKTEVMHLGRDLPLDLTFSCIAPVAGEHCGNCNKCAERQAAFRNSGIPDPTRYAR
jgi:7-cyano-7-deazaguanine synthase